MHKYEKKLSTVNYQLSTTQYRGGVFNIWYMIVNLFGKNEVNYSTIHYSNRTRRF